jgi:hypothetical protein
MNIFHIALGAAAVRGGEAPENVHENKGFNKAFFFCEWTVAVHHTYRNLYKMEEGKRL